MGREGRLSDFLAARSKRCPSQRITQGVEYQLFSEIWSAKVRSAGAKTACFVPKMPLNDVEKVRVLRIFLLDNSDFLPDLFRLLPFLPQKHPFRPPKITRSALCDCQNNLHKSGVAIFLTRRVTTLACRKRAERRKNPKNKP